MPASLSVPGLSSDVLENQGGRRNSPALPGEATRGSEATGAFSPLHCQLSSPRPCHACGSPPFTHLHDTRPCESRALGPRCGTAEREPFIQCQDATFPGRESQPSCLLHRVSTSGPLHRTVLLPGGHILWPSRLACPHPGVSALAPPVRHPQAPYPVLPPLLVSVTANVSWSWAPPRAPCGKGLCAPVPAESSSYTCYRHVCCHQYVYR